MSAMGNEQESLPSCSKSALSSLPNHASQKLNIDPVIALLDMDCFYVQVELRREPEFRGKPAGVTQYLTRYKGGGLIAVNYEARAHGVKRGCRAVEAKETCPDFKVFSVPELNGKADLTRYREAGSEVIQVMNKYYSVVERASIDEAFVDLTGEVKALLPRYLNGELSLTGEQLGTTCVVGWQTLEAWLDHLTVRTQHGRFESAEDDKALLNNLGLAIGAKLINELRGHILEETQFHCSAGISYSKTLSKLACGMNKPQKQTVLAGDRVMELFEKTKIQDVRFLGGKLGEQIVGYLGITFMAELCRVTQEKLLRFFEPKTAEWLQNLAKGWDDEMVKQRQLPKSIGCSKNFLGRLALRKRDEVKHWMTQFSHELSQRLKKDQFDNDRTATLLTAHMTVLENKEKKSMSRCCPLSSYETTLLAQDGFTTADKHLSSLGFQNGSYVFPVVSLGIVASKMKDGKESGATRIESYFSEVKKPDRLRARNNKVQQNLDKTSEKHEGDPIENRTNESVPKTIDSIDCRDEVMSSNQNESAGADYIVEFPVDEEISEDEALGLLLDGIESHREGTPVLFGDGLSDEVNHEENGSSNDALAGIQEEGDSIVVEESTITSDETLVPSTSRGFPKNDRKQPLRREGPSDPQVEVQGVERLASKQVNERMEGWQYKAFNCKKCQKYIWCPMLEQEHADYHLALELSKAGQPGVPRKKLKLDDVVVERKPKKSASSPSVPAKTPGLTLDHFFKKT